MTEKRGDDAREERRKRGVWEKTQKEGVRADAFGVQEEQSAFAQFIDQGEQPWPLDTLFLSSAAVQAALAA